MSKEHLEDVLDKFAQVTTVLVETAKVKDQLEKCNNINDLKSVLTQTKCQVDSLCEISKAVKKLFYKRYEQVSTDLNTFNGISVKQDYLDSNDETPDLEDTPNENTQQHPSIKLVDINTLVEPRKQSPSKKYVQFDNSVVIITSSDDDFSNTQESQRPTRKVIGDRVKKISIFPSSNRTRSTRRTRYKEHMLDRHVEISDTSSNDSEKESFTSDKLKNKVKPSKLKITEKSLINDPKLKRKCYVKVLKVPCEKLKEYYLEKLELLEIKKLTNITSLKRKRVNKTSSDLSASDASECNGTKKPKSKASLQNEELCETNGDSLVKDPEPKTNNGEQFGTDEEVALRINDKQDVPEIRQPTNEQGKNKHAELILDTMLRSSDEEENNKHSDTEEKTNQIPSPHDDDNIADSDNNKEVDKDQTDDKTECTEKEEQPEKYKSVNELHNDKDNKIKKLKDKEDENVTNGKAKQNSSWKNDKLLKDKLSSSDSEEEFGKFQKKKDKMKQRSSSSSDETISLPRQKKRFKKRNKKAVIDSDSGNDFQTLDENSSSLSESENNKDEAKEEEKHSNVKPRKRVKRVHDSSDEDDEEKSTRKQIRNILGRDSLAETTKKAEAEERERKARIADKQKKYNRSYEASAELNAKVDKVVLDYDEKNAKELLKVETELVRKLKPHQASGIQFMWDACFESLDRTKKTTGSGCILAHCMGLGKTLQVIALSHTLLIHSEETKVRKVMVVSPINTVLNWVSEYKQWLPDQEDYEIYELVSFKQNYERQYQLKSWHENGGVLIIGYDMFRNLSNPDNKRLSKKMRNSFMEILVDPGPDLVVCDEGHLLKNEKTNISIAMNRLKTLRRIVLTGTPLQNNLKEYFCMVQFIKPNLLGTYKEYLNRFVNPITNGQYTDSTLHDIQIMRKRSHVLHKMLDGIVQRRDYSVLQPYLPPKHEYVLFLTLSETQIQLYQHYMDNYARRSTDGSNRTSFLFVDFQALQRICTHPRVLLDKSKEIKKDKMDEDSEDESEGSIKDFIDDGDDDEDEAKSTSSGSGSSSDDVKPAKVNTAKKRLTRGALALAKENGEEIVDLEEEIIKKEWWQQFCDGDELNNIANSTKLFLLFEILKECEQIGDKVLVFSQSLYSLNIIEYFLGRVHDATECGNLDSVNGYSGAWCLGLDYFRLDGSSSCDNRSAWCKTFNDPTNTRSRLFLISTRAGGLGINLVAANRVIIFDVSWNPSHDVQSIYRVYRFGQTKPTYIYRFVSHGTMEMKIYERQVTKQAISKRVIDEQQIDRHYNQNDLAELYKFEPKPDNRPIPLVPKDILFGELLQKYEGRIFKYHEHQSLLENKTEEGLNEEERKSAWEEFENEKIQRSTNLGGNVMSPYNLMMALASMIRRKNPNTTDTEITTMLPLLQAQLQEQMSKGDKTLYNRVIQEINLLRAIQNQQLKEQFYQQQALKFLQQQQMSQMATNSKKQKRHPDFLPQFPNHQIAGTSQSNVSTSQQNSLTINEIIDLND